MRVLVTGGNGFIATNFIEVALKENFQVTSIDNLSVSSLKNNDDELLNNKNYRFIEDDILNKDLESLILDSSFNAIVNFAAESHVDKSIHDDEKFISTNINGTHNLICICKRLLEKKQLPSDFKFIQISTDEVYGSLKENESAFTELSPLCPTNPYSASKAAADVLCLSYFKTYKFPVIITRCSNNYGPYQYPEKLIPLSIDRINNRSEIPIYGDGQQIRDWIYVLDHCRGVLAALNHGKIGEVYNFGGESELTNTECLKRIINKIDSNIDPNGLFNFIDDRLGHDTRYAINPKKARSELGWKPNETFDSGILKTISWYSKNVKWLEDKTNTEEYKLWVATHY